MSLYRKKPVVIEALHYTGNVDALEAFVGRQLVWDNPRGGSVRPFISTLEGEMEVSDGDWIIKGVAGEFYPCKPDIFEQTYEAVME